MEFGESTALVGFDTRDSRGGTRGGRRDDRGHGEIDRCGDLGKDSSMVFYFYCKEPGHIKKICPKLIGKNIATIILICTCYDK